MFLSFLFFFRAKPRISTVPGRRSYTEEELNNALQDILSGKLGTRRAAVLYGIPRSTLRNKVYKLALEQKREVLANNPPVAVLETDGDDKDSDVDDEKDVDMKLNAMQSTEQLQAYMRAQMYENQANQQKNELKESKSPCETSQNMAGSSWPIDPNTWLQSLLLAGSSGGFGGMGALGGAFPALMQASPEELATLPEFLRKLLTQPLELKNSNNDHMDGGSSNGPSSAVNTMDHRLMMSLLSQQQHQQQKSLLQKQPRPSGTPETCSSLDLNDGTDDSQVILKVPSVKSLYGSSSGHNKNGDTTTSNSTPSTSPQISSVASVLSNTSPQPNHLSLRSPAAMLQRHRSESESPPFSINEVIRNSIRENFKIDKHSTPLMIDPMDHYGKRPSISVIKNLGGTDISRFGSNPNITQSMNQHNQMGPLSPNTGTGGKGTRPKRGKYRNYDRDSLVEAVKAVQRGEMSVHRAGSYYGVPHSTLEYKVKERHLMRPRKREPKPQPTDDRTGAGPSAKSQEIGGGGGGSGAGLRTMDKNKTLSNNKAPLKPPFPSPNGMKMPIFDPAMAAQLQYTSQLFWQHPGSFPGMSGLDFARAAAAASQNPAANTPGFPPNADFFTQQMLQKFQEDHSFKSPVNGNSGGGGGGSGNGANSGGGGGGGQSSNNNNNTKTQRDLDSLYDAVGTNGSSFLDGIIRQSLDKKPNDIVQGTFIEQLLKQTKTSRTSSGPSDDDDYSPASSQHNNKRSGSPMNYSHLPEIKRERASPSSIDTDSEYMLADTQQMSKLRENLTQNNSGAHDELNNGGSKNQEIAETSS